MWMRPGTYTIEMRAPGQPQFAEKIYVVAGKTVHVEPGSIRKPGSSLGDPTGATGAAQAKAPAPDYPDRGGESTRSTPDPENCCAASRRKSGGRGAAGSKCSWAMPRASASRCACR